MEENTKRVYEIIEYDSKESNIDIIELLNDMIYIMELADSLDMSLEDMATITNEIEKELMNNDIKELRELLNDLKHEYVENNKTIYLVLGNQGISINKKTFKTNNRYYSNIKEIIQEITKR